MLQRAPAQPRGDRPHYLGPPAPLAFPEEAEVPETQVHFELPVLNLRWVVGAADDHATALRVTQGVDSDALVPTRKEARQAAERRVLELEAELRRCS